MLDHGHLGLILRIGLKHGETSTVLEGSPKLNYVLPLSYCLAINHSLSKKRLFPAFDYSAIKLDILNSSRKSFLKATISHLQAIQKYIT